MMSPSPNLALNIENLTAGYPGNIVLQDVSFKVRRGSLAAIIGPNGGGKSTLLKTAVGLLEPVNYKVLNLLGQSPQKGRRRVAYLPQQEEVDWDFPITVFDVVLQGRLVRQGLWGRYTKGDYASSHEALEFFGLGKYKETQIGALSGGQRQRAFLARALVQEADLILLDEPSTGLDAKAQHEMAELFTTLSKNGKTIVAATHDLNCLTECFDYVLALNGRVLAEGKPDEVLTEANMVELFARHFPKVGASGEVTLHEH
ncbi:MAG TPA: manganese ABC transporter ATP-binding protein, partial [Firmicutes bacterium]|nr:manganese ABC transporter ATP-binding protein [Bacillota bacterium]